jgi:hypothetical protein
LLFDGIESVDNPQHSVGAKLQVTVATRALIPMRDFASDCRTARSINLRLCGKITLRAESAKPNHKTIRKLICLPLRPVARMPAHNSHKSRLTWMPKGNSGTNRTRALA